MGIEPDDMAEQARFREYYKSLTDDDLVRLAMDENLIPVARNAVSEELEARGLRDFSSFKNRFVEEAALARAAGAEGAFLSALPTDQKHRRLLGAIWLGLFGLVGVHKWLLGDATTWRNEEALAMWLFWALFFTWSPLVRVLNGEASGKFLFWLILGLLYFTVIAALLAVPSLGQIVSGFSPLLVAAIIGSPAIVIGARRAVTRFGKQSR